MLKPEKMFYTRLVLLENVYLKFIKEMGHLACFQFTPFQLTKQPEAELKKIDQGKIINELETLQKSLVLLAEKLNIPLHAEEVSIKDKDVNPKHILKDIMPQLAMLEEEVNTALIENTLFENEIADLSLFSEHLSVLKHAHIQLSDLTKIKNLYFRFGTLKTNYLSSLHDHLKGLNYFLHHQEIQNQNTSVLLIAHKENKDKIHQILSSLPFVDADLSKTKTSKNILEHIEHIEEKIWHKKECIIENKRKFLKFSQSHKKLFNEWHKLIDVNVHVLHTVKNIGYKGHFYYITGWIPKSAIKKLQETLSLLTDPHYYVEIFEDKEISIPKDKIPVYLKNPKWLKPFETLVSVYGIPSYSEIDPTFFVGLSFIFMFGMMFGDVGHGFMIFLIGILLKKFKPSLKLASLLCMLLGLSSMFFGFLFGSIFCFEHVIPALWFHPLNNISFTFSIAIAFGVGFMSLGFILNLLGTLKKRDLKGFIAGQYGLLTFIFYWLSILTVLNLVTHTVKISPVILLTSLGLPLISLLIIDLCWPLLQKAHAKKEEHESIFELVLKPMELVTSLLCHTLSFIRVGAFALNHTALASTVILISQLLHRQHLDSVTFIVGNLAIIIEGFIVAIQITRLEFYEFFSKFYKGEGDLFKPLVLK